MRRPSVLFLFAYQFFMTCTQDGSCEEIRLAVSSGKKRHPTTCWFSMFGVGRKAICSLRYVLFTVENCCPKVTKDWLFWVERDLMFPDCLHSTQNLRDQEPHHNSLKGNHPGWVDHTPTLLYRRSLPTRDIKPQLDSQGRWVFGNRGREPNKINTTQAHPRAEPFSRGWSPLLLPTPKPQGSGRIAILSWVAAGLEGGHKTQMERGRSG